MSAVVAQGRGLVPIPDLHADEGTLGPVLAPGRDPGLAHVPVTGGRVLAHMTPEMTGLALGHVRGESPVLVLVQGPMSAPAKKSPWRKGKVVLNLDQPQQAQNAPGNPALVPLHPRRRSEPTVPRMGNRQKWMLWTTKTNCTGGNHPQ